MSMIDEWKAARDVLEDVSIDVRTMMTAKDTAHPDLPTVRIDYGGVNHHGLQSSMDFKLRGSSLPNDKGPLGKYLAAAINKSMPELLEKAVALAREDARQAGQRALAEARALIEDGEVRDFLGEDDLKDGPVA